MKFVISCESEKFKEFAEIQSQEIADHAGSGCILQKCLEQLRVVESDICQTWQKSIGAREPEVGIVCSPALRAACASCALASQNLAAFSPATGYEGFLEGIEVFQHLNRYERSRVLGCKSPATPPESTLQ